MPNSPQVHPINWTNQFLIGPGTALIRTDAVEKCSFVVTVVGLVICDVVPSDQLSIFREYVCCSRVDFKLPDFSDDVRPFR